MGSTPSFMVSLLREKGQEGEVWQGEDGKGTETLLDFKVGVP